MVQNHQDGLRRPLSLPHLQMGFFPTLDPWPFLGAFTLENVTANYACTPMTPKPSLRLLPILQIRNTFLRNLRAVPATRDHQRRQTPLSRSLWEGRGLADDEQTHMA